MSDMFYKIVILYYDIYLNYDTYIQWLLKASCSHMKINSYYDLWVENEQNTHPVCFTVCPGSSDQFYIVTYYIKWVTTSWTYSTMVQEEPVEGMQRVFMNSRYRLHSIQANILTFLKVFLTE